MIQVRLTVNTRRYMISLLTTLTLFCLLAGVLQINSAARSTMSENAVPTLSGNGNGIIENIFDGCGLSALRSVIAKIFPYAALVIEVLIYAFFAIIGTQL